MYNEGVKTFTANGAIGDKIRVKLTASSATSPPQVEVAGAGEQHIGITEYAAADATLVAVRLRTYPGTHEGTATISSAIAVGTVLYAAASGKISDASTGTAIGIAAEAASSNNDIIEFLDFTVISTTAATISVADSGGHFTTDTVEAALAQLAVGAKTAQYTIQPSALMLESGAAIGAFANGTTDGWTQLSSKAMALRWNDGGTPTDMVAQFILPQDYDDTAVVVAHFLGAIVKAGGSEVDSPTMAVEAYFDVAGVAPAGDTDCGGSSGEFLTASGAVLQEKTLSITADNALAAPTVLTLIFHPTDGELGTDDFVCLPPWLEVTRKILTA